MCNCLAPVTVDHAKTEKVIGDVTKSQTDCHSWPSHVCQEPGRSISLSHKQGSSLTGGGG